MNQAVTSPVIELQLGHRSIRRYTGEPIAPGLLASLIRAGQAAASSSFIQAYSVIQVARPEARAAIARAAGHQTWIERAAEFLVVCADLRRVDSACRSTGYGRLEGWTEHGLTAVVDAALMAQNLLHQDVYQDPGAERLADYDLIMADYYAHRGNQARRGDWSSTAARAVQDKKREHMLPFLRGLRFFRN